MRVFEVACNGPGRLAVVSRPSSESLHIELQRLREAGFTGLVSLLAAAEVEELGLRDEPAEAERAGLGFTSFPIPDYSTPESEHFRQLIFRLHDDYRAGGAVAAHCRGSVGRAPLLVASLLVLDGVTPADAWRRVSDARGVPVPDTDAQRRWIELLSPRG